MDNNNILDIPNISKYMFISKIKRQTIKSKQKSQIYGNNTSAQ